LKTKLGILQPEIVRQMIRKELSFSDWLLIAANFLPVIGVWFWGWHPTEAFLVYALETLIVGIITACKILVATLVRGKEEWYAKGKKIQLSGIFFIFFFIAHYGIFALVQTTMFSQAAGITPPGSGLFHFFFKWYTYVNDDVLYMLLGFTISYIIRNFMPFVLNNEYKNTSFLIIMFQPYGRIIIQQFTVILGSMFLVLGAGKIFILVFAVIKILFELFIDYKFSWNKLVEKVKKTSSEQ
jgi:hypothetical protein